LNRLVIYIVLLIIIPLLVFGGTYKIKTINKTGVVNLSMGVGFYVPVLNWATNAFTGGAGFNIDSGFGVSSHFGFFGGLNYIRLRADENLNTNFGTGRIRIWNIRGGMRYTMFTAVERSPFGEASLGYSWMKVGGTIGEKSQKLWFIDLRCGYELFVDKTKSIDLSTGLIYYLQHPDFNGLALPSLEGARKAAIIPLRFNFNFYF